MLSNFKNNVHDQFIKQSFKNIKLLNTQTIPKNTDIYGKSSLVLITGGASGLGLELAINLANRKVNVIIVDVSYPKKNLFPREYLHFYNCDISNLKEVQLLRKNILIDLGPITILINNAGITSISPLVKTDNKQIKRVMDVNYLGAYIMAQVFLPDISRAKVGGIVNVASILGMITPARLCAYGASKSGLIFLHESLTYQLEKNNLVKDNQRNIKTLLVCPGKIKTAMFERVETPSKILAPDIDPKQLANLIISKLQENGTNVLMAPYYTNFIPLFKILDWPYIQMLKRVSGMNDVTNI